MSFSCVVPQKVFVPWFWGYKYLINLCYTETLFIVVFPSYLQIKRKIKKVVLYCTSKFRISNTAILSFPCCCGWPSLIALGPIKRGSKLSSLSSKLARNFCSSLDWIQVWKLQRTLLSSKLESNGFIFQDLNPIRFCLKLKPYL